LIELEIYQWLVPLISVFFLIRTGLQYSKKRRTVLSTIIWFTFWIVLMVLAIIPNEISDSIAKILGFRSNINAVIFVALGFLFLFIFYLSSTIERLEAKITRLIRKQAIESKELADKQKELLELKQDLEIN